MKNIFAALLFASVGTALCAKLSARSSRAPTVMRYDRAPQRKP
jgi:hypothetical protein